MRVSNTLQKILQKLNKIIWFRKKKTIMVSVVKLELKKKGSKSEIVCKQYYVSYSQFPRHLFATVSID